MSSIAKYAKNGASNLQLGFRIFMKSCLSLSPSSRPSVRAAAAAVYFPGRSNGIQQQVGKRKRERKKGELGWGLGRAEGGKDAAVYLQTETGASYKKSFSSSR